MVRRIVGAARAMWSCLLEFAEPLFVIAEVALGVALVVVLVLVIAGVLS